MYSDTDRAVKILTLTKQKVKIILLELQMLHLHLNKVICIRIVIIAMRLMTSFEPYSAIKILESERNVCLV